MHKDDFQKQIFREKQINNFASLYDTLKRIHSRLIQEGYIVDPSRKQIILSQNSSHTNNMVSGMVKSN